MSLINKVLRDLEARERGEQAAPQRPVLEDLRAAPEPPGPSPAAWLKWAALVLAIAAIAGAAWWYGYTQRPTRAPAARIGTAPQPQGAPARRPIPPPVLPQPSRRSAPAVRVLTASPKAVPAAVPALAGRHPAAHAAPRRFVFRSSGTISRHRTPLTAAQKALAAYRRAVRALQAGHTGRARTILGASLHEYPQGLRPALLLATLDIQASRLREAHDVLRQALRGHPGALAAAMLLAQVDLRRGRPGDAARILTRFRPAGASSRSYWALLAASRSRAGDPAAALAAYQSGLRRFPRDGALWVGLGVIESQSGHAAHAYKAWRRAEACPLTPVLAQFVQAQLRAAGGTHRDR